MITLETTSNNSEWSPHRVTNSSATLFWSVSGGGLEFPEEETDDPTFNLLDNQGTTTITIRSDEGFIGLTDLDLWVEPEGGEITSIDVTNAGSLTNLNMRYNNLESFDVSNNILLTRLTVRGEDQLLNQTLNTSLNSGLTFLQADNTGIVAVDLANNDALIDVRLNRSRLTSSELDKILI